MSQTANLLSLNNELLRTYLFYSAVLVIKTVLMSLLTASQRFKNKTISLAQIVTELWNLFLTYFPSCIIYSGLTLWGEVLGLYSLILVEGNKTQIYFYELLWPIATIAFANPEDGGPKKLKVKVDENVERVRRAHLNDLENIPTFIIASFAYILTNPEVGFATLLFRVFTAARFVHTFVYAVVVIPQPARALAFMVGLFITIYMSVASILHFM